MQLKRSGYAKWLERVRRNARLMEAAGIACAAVPRDAFAPGIEHRRVIWAHAASRNAGAAAAAVWTLTGVGALHSFASDVVEFRETATGRLVAFSLTTARGAYAAGVLYVARPEVARAGLWCGAGAASTSARARASVSTDDVCNPPVAAG